MSVGSTLERPPVALDGHSVLFLPHAPGRLSSFAFWGGPSPDPVHGEDEALELVVPAGRTVRRRRVEASVLPMPAAIELLVAVAPDDETDDTVLAWATVVRIGLSFVARGLLLPAM